jgi:hypothetical protein
MRFMPIREFLRGGYQRITEPTVVSSHGRPIFTVMPSWSPVMPAPVARAGGGSDALPKEATPTEPEDPVDARPVEDLRERRGAVEST